MTVAENIKRSTKPNTLERFSKGFHNFVKRKSLLDVGIDQISCYEFQFIDGSKLICRVYW